MSSKIPLPPLSKNRIYDARGDIPFVDVGNLAGIPDFEPLT
jgi:hypothetical protein